MNDKVKLQQNVCNNESAPQREDSKVAPIRPAILSPTSQIGVGVPDADAVAREITTSIGTNHARVSQGLADYFARTRTFWERIFKTKLDKLLEDEQLRQATTELQFQHRMLELATESKFQAARETVEAWVRALKLSQRERFGTFAMERLEAFQHTVEDRRRAFVHEIQRTQHTLNTCADIPQLHERYRQSVQREIENFFELVDSLLEDFKNVVHERVVTFDRPTLPSK